MQGLHAKDGWHFRREPDGSVTVYADDTGGSPREVTLDAGTWASAVASVSRHGETGGTWRAALNLHGNPVDGPARFILNTREHTMASRFVTYEQLSWLAGIDPGHCPSICYERAIGPRASGTLVRGETVEVDDGRTVIDAMITGNA